MGIAFVSMGCIDGANGVCGGGVTGIVGVGGGRGIGNVCGGIPNVTVAWATAELIIATVRGLRACDPRASASRERERPLERRRGDLERREADRVRLRGGVTGFVARIVARFFAHALPPPSPSQLPEAS